MLKYTYEQLKTIVKNIVGNDDFDIIPIGNHELNRHLVYMVKPKGINPLVIKFYYKTNRRNREIASFKILSNSSVKCARIIKYGELDDGTEWLLCGYVEGHPFDRVIHSIPHEDRLEIFMDMGRELGKIHSIRQFDFFGNWDEDGSSIDNIKDCTVSFIISMEYSIREIQQQALPHQDLLEKAIIKIRNSYHILDGIKESRLRHNDFDGRNILVKKDDKKWVLSGIIDFEQSTPGNVEMDIAGLYHKYFLGNKEYEKSFLKGYNEYFKLPEEFYDRLNFYLLCAGVTICSWAFDAAPDYYNEGLKLVKAYV